MKISEKIKKRRKELKWSQARLSKECGWASQSRICHYENGNREPALEDIPILEKALKLKPGYLTMPQNSIDKITFGDNIVFVSAAANLPIITMMEYAMVKSGVTDIAIQGSRETIPVPNDCKEFYAVKVETDVMTGQPREKFSFDKGDILIIDDKREPVDNNFVLISVDGQDEPIFSQLVSYGNKQLLKPVNVAYPTLEFQKNKMKVIGVVIRKIQSMLVV